MRQVDVVSIPRDPDIPVEALDHGHEIHVEKVPELEYISSNEY